MLVVVAIVFGAVADVSKVEAGVSVVAAGVLVVAGVLLVETGVLVVAGFVGSRNRRVSSDRRFFANGSRCASCDSRRVALERICF